MKLTFLTDGFIKMDEKTKLLQTKLFDVVDTLVSDINTTDTDYIEQSGKESFTMSPIPYGNRTTPKFIRMSKYSHVCCQLFSPYDIKKLTSWWIHH